MNSIAEALMQAARATGKAIRKPGKVPRARTRLLGALTLCPVHPDQIKPCKRCDRIFAAAADQRAAQRRAEQKAAHELWLHERYQDKRWQAIQRNKSS